MELRELNVKWVIVILPSFICHCFFDSEQESLNFLCRLSYHQRIVDIVPPTFSALIPPEPIFIYKYEDESACKTNKFTF